MISIDTPLGTEVWLANRNHTRGYVYGGPPFHGFTVRVVLEKRWGKNAFVTDGGRFDLEDLHLDSVSALRSVQEHMDTIRERHVEALKRIDRDQADIAQAIKAETARAPDE